MTQYIDKAALVAEIKRRIANMKGYCLREEHDTRFDVVPEQLSLILSFIDTLEVKEVDLENRTKILADIIFDAAKHGYMPYDTQDEHCAMEKARRNIIKLI